MRTVRWGRAVLGEGMPKIAVPVMGKSIEQLAEAAQRAASARADVIELRIDSLSPMPDEDTALAACRAVREAAGEIPLLFTLRTQRDGGPGSADVAAYEALLCAVARAKVCEAIDCELSAGDEVFVRVAAAAHAAGVSLVGSSHAFEAGTPPERAKAWLLRQHALGADVCKAAVMATDELEALRLSAAMLEASRELDAPIIAIAMGPKGTLSRVGAECLGSCLTFGTAGEASAPGQLDAETLRGVLEAIHAAVQQ